MPEDLDPTKEQARKRTEEEERLVIAAQDGDSGAFERLFRSYFPRVRGLLRSVGLKPEDAEDLAQEVFQRAHRYLPTFRRECGFGTWLLSLARSVRMNDERGRQALKRKGHAVPLEAVLGDWHPLEIPAKDAGPLERVLRHEQVRELRDAIMALPDKMRQCCFLRYAQGLSYQEIAKILKISQSTIKSHINQGRHRIQKRLSRRFDIPE